MLPSPAVTPPLRGRRCVLTSPRCTRPSRCRRAKRPGRSRLSGASASSPSRTLRSCCATTTASTPPCPRLRARCPCTSSTILTLIPALWTSGSAWLSTRPRARPCGFRRGTCTAGSATESVNGATAGWWATSQQMACGASSKTSRSRRITHWPAALRLGRTRRYIVCRTPRRRPNRPSGACTGSTCSSGLRTSLCSRRASRRPTQRARQLWTVSGSSCTSIACLRRTARRRPMPTPPRGCSRALSTRMRYARAAPKRRRCWPKWPPTATVH
mmetsp:Transcript_24928/g.78593  ORF Transcript_24928/g.78593 Transcript_24928/m.78593 type:complete len:271 (-) Transcript_24928:114-926(-)